MKILYPSSQFKKDFKRYRHEVKKVEVLKEVLNMLIKEVPLPPKYRQHTLRGQFKGCLECHIESDFLLIWIDEKQGVIELVRLGSHSELFGR